MSGYKTYICAAIAALAMFAGWMKWITPETVEIIVGLAIPGGLAALRAGVKKGAE